MKYLKLGMNRKYYSIAWKRYRNEVLTDSLGAVMSTVIVLIVVLVVYNKFFKEKLKKNGRLREQTGKEDLLK